jgi:hypothetical protein
MGVSMTDDESEDMYDTCLCCGKQVFPGVSDCPYCHNDPYSHFHECTYCGKSLPPDAARCPYCDNYTDGQGHRQGVRGQGQGRAERGSTFRKPDGSMKTIYVFIGWLLVLASILPLAMEFYYWVLRG